MICCPQPISSLLTCAGKLHRILLTILVLVTAIVLTACSPTARPPTRDELIAADDARIAAMVAADASALNHLLSTDLYYAHSNGKVDTKESMIGDLTSGRVKYHSLQYRRREFTFPAERVALMTGQVRVLAAAGDKSVDLMLAEMALWRLEDGHWRLLARQASPLPN